MPPKKPRSSVGHSATRTTIPKMVKGACYRNCTVIAHTLADGASIVHGTVNLETGKRGGHAWIEEGGKVIDPTAGIILPRSEYYNSNLKPYPMARYTPEESMIKAIREGHHGPWHE